MTTSISIEDLTFTYPGQNQPALRHIQGQIENGTFLVIMGPGGAGKSSLCYSMNGLIPSFFRGTYHGKLVIHGKEAARCPVAEMSRSVGLVLQDFETQLFSTNVELEMAFGPENLCLPREEVDRRVRHYLAMMGLESYRSREPATLSGGEKQRLAVGSVLAMEPEILVLDEPATDLDPRGRKEVFSLSHLLREKGRTVLLVDPDPESAVDADQVWLMNGGEILARGRPSEILGNRSLMKSSGMTPHPLVELFEELGWSGRPLTFEEAKESIQKDQRVQPKRVEPRPFSPRGTPSAPVLKVENLTYHYPVHGIEALRGIDLHIAGGEFIALLGQNGSGKTTLAKHLNGLLKPSSGQVLVDGKPTTRYPRRELARRVGYVFQNPDHQIFAKTVWEEVGFGLKMLGESPGRMEERVGKALEAVGLSGYETRMPFTLTKGERQRVAVASVLAAQPQVILLDEPTTGLDPVQQRGMMEMLVRLNQAGHTILIITHSMEIAAAYADRTVVMKGGSILLDGPTRSVFFDEENLAEASLFPPLLVRLSNWLGTRALTVRQMVEELKP